MSMAKYVQKRHALSEALRQLIDLANSVPPEVDLPAPHGRVQEVVEMLGSERFSEFRRLTGPITPDTFLSKFIGPDAPETYNRVLGNYIRLRDGRNWLRQAALIGEQSRAVKIRYLMPMPTVQTNDRGELEFNVDPLIEALKGAEACRIRICPICGAIYWAARKDQPCCGKRCGKIRRTRRWRGKYPNRYKLRRLGIPVPAELEAGSNFQKESNKQETLETVRGTNRGALHAATESPLMPGRANGGRHRGDVDGHHGGDEHAGDPRQSDRRFLMT